MGLDTVKLRSPFVNDGIATFLEHQSILRQGIDLGSGEILYEITTGELDGSWDSRVSFRVMRSDWIDQGAGIRQVDCEPYIVVEASLHKFFYGQNVYGGPTDFQIRIALFIDLLGDLLGADQDMLPSAGLWQVRRVDWAEVYRLSPAAIADFFRGISHCKFPRRSAKSAKYGVNAVYFPGAHTTLKLYHKGPEFKEHDRSRLRHSLTVYSNKQQGDERPTDHDRSDPRPGLQDSLHRNIHQWVDKKMIALQRLADNRLRVEVEIHSDKLSYDFQGRFPLVSEVTDDYLKKVHDTEVFKLLREGKTEMETVRNHDAVKARLNQLYGRRSANALFSFWLQLAVRGEDMIRVEYSRSRFYLNRKKLVDAAVSWLSSDVFIVANDSALPRDFRPLRDDKRLCFKPVSNNSVFNFCPVAWGQLKAAA